MHSTTDPVMRDLDRHLADIDDAEADEAAETFDVILDEAQDYLARAFRAWEDGKRAAACDLLISASKVLHGASDIDTTTAADAPEED